MSGAFPSPSQYPNQYAIGYLAALVAAAVTTALWILRSQAIVQIPGWAIPLACFTCLTCFLCFTVPMIRASWLEEQRRFRAVLREAEQAKLDAALPPLVRRANELLGEIKKWDPTDRRPTSELHVRWSEINNCLAQEVLGWHIESADPRRLWRHPDGTPVRVNSWSDEMYVCQHPFDPDANHDTDTSYCPWPNHHFREIDWIAWTRRAVMDPNLNRSGLAIECRRRD